MAQAVKEHANDMEAKPIGTDFVGRRDALATLHRVLNRAREGRGGVVLMSGEPGIGKTRCAEEFAQHAEDQGALVLWGRCFEQPGTPPYWPWVQLLRACAEGASDDELRLMLGEDAGLVASIVPEFSRRLEPEGIDTPDAASPGGQFRLFDVFTTMFSAIAERVPLVLVLDDLHWADESSLALLEFLVKDVHRASLCLVCIYRDVGVSRKSPFFNTLGELGRARRATRVRLAGLTTDDIDRLATATVGFALPAQVVQSICEQTDGNPFFVSEVARLIAEISRSSQGSVIAVDVPDGVREAIGRRLDALSPECSGLLRCAAVAGRDFDVRVVAGALGCGPEQCLALLDDAVQAGLIEEQAVAMRARFTHALIRETVYDELSTLHRLRLHESIGNALVALQSDNLDPVLSEVVHHFCEAAALGEHERAVEFAVQAAARDERMLALEEACRHHGKVVEVLEANGCGDDLRAGWASYRRGYFATGQGQFALALENLVRAVGIARKRGDAELFVRSAAAMVQLTSDGDQVHTTRLLEDALEILPDDDYEHRALALAHLAFALRTSRGDRVREVGEAAVSLARQSQQPHTLATALRVTIMALRGDPATLAQRLEYGSEMVALGEAIGDIEEMTEGWYWHLLNLLEAGEIDAMEKLLRRQLATSARHKMMHHHLTASLLDIALQMLHGRWSGLEERIEKALLRAQKIRQGDADGVYGAQMFQLNRDLGRLRTMAPVVQRLLDDPDARLWPPGTMLMCCEVGLLDRAREHFEALAQNDFATIPHDDMRTTCLVHCAEACARLGDAERAAVLYRLLMPYAEQTVGHGQVTCFGSAAMFLGLLAQTLGKPDVARGHYESAIAMNRSMSAWPALARCQFLLARMLMSGESADDRNVGRQLLGEAEQLAARFTMAGLTEEIEALLAGGATRLPDDLTLREAEVLGLLAIGRSNKDIAKVLSISLSTVATHVRNILQKTGCANRTEAAAYAMKQELL